MEKFLNELKLIYYKYQIIDKNKSNFNIFNLLLNPYDEVNLHSKMLYSILNEKKYGKEFQKSFLKELGLIKSNNDINSFIVEREKVIDTGRLDLYIEYKKNTETIRIIIENKIYAADGDRQLDRYLAYLDRYQSLERPVYYLTLNGDEPTEISTNSLERINLISYENEILNWLDSCINIAAREPSIRETLIQYSQLIEEITGKDVDYIMETKNYFLKNSDNFNMAINLEPAITEAKVDLQFKFWEKLEDNLNGYFENQNDLTVKSCKDSKILNKYDQWYAKDIIKNNYQTSRVSYDYGITYSLGDFDQIGPLYLKLEYSRYSGLYYGLRLNIEPINTGSKAYETLYKKLDANNFEFTKLWLGWKYLYFNNNVIRFNFKDHDFVEVLMDDEKIDELINNISEEINEFIKLISE